MVAQTHLMDPPAASLRCAAPKGFERGGEGDRSADFGGSRGRASAELFAAEAGGRRL